MRTKSSAFFGIAWWNSIGMVCLCSSKLFFAVKICHRVVNVKIDFFIHYIYFFWRFVSDLYFVCHLIFSRLWFSRPSISHPARRVNKSFQTWVHRSLMYFFISAEVNFRSLRRKFYYKIAYLCYFLFRKCRMTFLLCSQLSANKVLRFLMTWKKNSIFASFCSCRVQCRCSVRKFRRYTGCGFPGTQADSATELSGFCRSNILHTFFCSRKKFNLQMFFQSVGNFTSVAVISPKLNFRFTRLISENRQQPDWIL